jgi:hypothetical protein
VYVNASLGFALSPPPGWVQTAAPDVVVAFTEPGPGAVRPRPASRRPESDREFLERIRHTLTAADADPGRIRPNIVVISVRKAGLSLPTYVKQTRSRANRVKGCSVLGEADRRLGGLYAVERTTRTYVADGPPIRTREVMCRRADRIFVITLAAPGPQYRHYSALFDRTLASFRWR